MRTAWLSLVLVAAACGGDDASDVIDAAVVDAAEVDAVDRDAADRDAADRDATDLDAADRDATDLDATDLDAADRDAADLDAAAIDATALDAAAIDAAAIDATDLDATDLDAALDADVVDAVPPDAAPTNTGFPTPTAVAKANRKQGPAWIELGDADWSCLGTPTSDQPATTSLALTGFVRDYLTGDGAGAVQVTAFPMLHPATSLGTAITSNLAIDRGEFAMTAAPLPVGVRRYGFQSDAIGRVRTYSLGRYLTPGAAQAVTLDALRADTADTLTAFVGIVRDPTRGLVLGRMLDCQGLPVSNAVAAISTTAGTVTLPADTTTYYFDAGPSTSRPVVHTHAPTLNRDGQFMVIQLPPLATAYVQVWGFRTTADLASGVMTLLAEAPILAEANAASIIDLRPLRAP